MSARLKIGAAIGLAVLLLSTAGLKFAAILRGQPLGLPAVLGGLEVGFAIAVLVPRAREAAALIVAGATAGAAVVMLLSTSGLRSPCGCLGVIEVAEGIHLMLQGTLVILAGLVARPAAAG